MRSRIDLRLIANVSKKIRPIRLEDEEILTFIQIVNKRTYELK